MASRMSALPVFRWKETCLKIKDPSASVPFYKDLFGMELVKEAKEQGQPACYYLASIRGKEDGGTDFDMEANTRLKLAHSTEPTSWEVATGNTEPYRGFGHIAFLVDDVYDACDKLASAGVKFQKKPDEGRMKGLAFALDPDGYWIEIVSRTAGKYKKYYNLGQTMLRIKDPQKSLRLYRDTLGMRVLHEKHFAEHKFSLYFLQSPSSADPPLDASAIPEDLSSEAANELISSLWNPILELTHNHGTENDSDFSYHNGHSASPGEPQGFQHISFEVEGGATDEVVQAVVDRVEGCSPLEEDGKVVGLTDCDGYHVHFISA